MTIDLSQIDWPETLQRFGIDARYLVNKQGPCPMHPNHGKTKFRFDNKGGQGTWICNDCGAGGGFALLRHFTGMPDREIFNKLEELISTGDTQCVIGRSHIPWVEDDLTDEEKSKRKARLQRAWKNSTRLRTDSVVLAYLKRRVPGMMLEWVSNFIHQAQMPYFAEEGSRLVDRGSFPVMLAKACDHGAEHPVSTTLHRTYLSDQGEKAPFEKVKKQMSSHLKLSGAAIRINTAANGTRAFVCEGIETGFAIVAMTENRFPVYVALNAGNLEAFKVPAWVKQLEICADHDAPDSRGVQKGIEKARSLEARMKSLGINARVFFPKMQGEDWNDYYVRRINEQRSQTSREQNSAIEGGSWKSPSKITTNAQRMAA